MSKVQVSGRQDVISAVVDITAATVADVVTTGIACAVELPKGAVVVGGDITVSEVFNSTTNTLAPGDGSSGTRYHAAVNLKALGRTALTPDGLEYTALDTVDGFYVFTGSLPTTGKARLRVDYIVLKRVEFSQGLDTGGDFPAQIDNNP